MNPARRTFIARSYDMSNGTARHTWPGCRLRIHHRKNKATIRVYCTFGNLGNIPDLTRDSTNLSHPVAMSFSIAMAQRTGRSGNDTSGYCRAPLISESLPTRSRIAIVRLRFSISTCRQPSTSCRAMLLTASPTRSRSRPERTLAPWIHSFRPEALLRPNLIPSPARDPQTGRHGRGKCL